MGRPGNRRRGHHGIAGKGRGAGEGVAGKVAGEEMARRDWRGGGCEEGVAGRVLQGGCGRAGGHGKREEGL